MVVTKLVFPLRWTEHILMAAESVWWTQGRSKQPEHSHPKEVACPAPRRACELQKGGYCGFQPQNPQRKVSVVISSKPDTPISLRWNMDLEYGNSELRADGQGVKRGPRMSVTNVTLASPPMLIQQSTSATVYSPFPKVILNGFYLTFMTFSVIYFIVLHILKVLPIQLLANNILSGYREYKLGYQARS